MATPIAGFPDATTTGVPAGTSLTNYTDPMTITTDGTVIENKIINGSLRVTGDNVVIKNCQITYNSSWGIDAEGAGNITIQNCDIVGPGYNGDGNAAILGSGTFLRNDISKSENGIVLTDGASTVKGNFIHDLQAAGADPHYDGISVQGGQNGVLIEDNTIVGRDTSDIIINNDFGSVNDVKINHNLLIGDPGYSIYVFGAETTNVTVSNNYVEKGHWGYYSIDYTTPVLSNNVLLPEGDYYPVPSSGGPTPPPPDPTPSPNPDPTPPPTDHTFTGTEGNDLLPVTGQSNAGNDTFSGLGGNDTLTGGAGADRIDGGSGIDTASYAGSNAAVNVNLQTGTGSGGHATGDTLVNIENLTGSSYNDILTGNSGNNVLDGGAGADTMRGGAGDDTYVVDNAGDVVNESVAGSNGSDTVRTSISFSLADTAHVLGDVGILVLTGNANINGTGNGLDNPITGNAGANVLNGGAGNDTLNGGAGNDTLNGGAGNDTLTGGAGNDTFVFNDALSAANNVDRITGFSTVSDTIQLENSVFTALTSTGTLARGAFYVGAAAHDANDHIIYNPVTGALTYDSNGNAPGGATQIATLDPGLSLTRADFVVA